MGVGVGVVGDDRTEPTFGMGESFHLLRLTNADLPASENTWWNPRHHFHAWSEPRPPSPRIIT